MGKQESGPSYLTGWEDVGTPSIVNNIMTPSSDSWIRTPAAFSPGNSTWSLIFRVKKIYSSGYQNIASGAGIMLQCSSNSYDCKVYLAHGSSYDILNGGYTIRLDGSSYLYVRVRFDGSKYYFGTSSDGEAYTEQYMTSSSTIRGNAKIAFGAKASNTNKVGADYDLTHMEIWIDGEIWWKAIA